MTKTLPVILLNGVQYFIDNRLQQFRQVKNPHQFIDFGCLKDEGDFFILRLHIKTGKPLTEMTPIQDVIECHIMKIHIDYDA